MAFTTQEKHIAAPWYAAYPDPKADPAFLTRDEVLSLLQDTGHVAGKNFVLVDLRRNDHQGGTIEGSINLPAQSLWPIIPTVYQMFKAAGVRKVIFYCGSSRGRGCRAGGWFADHIKAQNDKDMQSLVLQGGIKGWVKAGSQFTDKMLEYDAAAWEA
ncbi:hypothetical protein HMPREF1624_08157 [Sporothrix schenckii ATCC 58251]|uniref:Rhodanese domain-containing protein n=1 Tax=Sporothrix schenckii (strain ATCC 58251 / de Perez 2211183) TaxID=1391915 RepID=U7PL69_SPOS1|nr:hypothetical protein HMPREF1624_08157 [Sporothrix schenckii ATCC 58251]